MQGTWPQELTAQCTSDKDQPGEARELPRGGGSWRLASQKQGSVGTFQEAMASRCSPAIGPFSDSGRVPWGSTFWGPCTNCGPVRMAFSRRSPV